MMYAKSKDYFISSHGQLAIQSWGSLYTIILNMLMLNDERIKTKHENKIPHLFSSKEIQDIRYGPYQAYFHKEFNAYIHLTKSRIPVYAQTNDFLNPIKNHIITITHPSKISKDNCHDVQGKLNQITEQHYAQWKIHANQWSKEIIATLATAGLVLTDSENAMIQEQDLTSQVIAQFQERQLKRPTSQLNTMHDFLKTKTYQSIHSALSRQHKHHTHIIIMKHIKAIKDCFNTIKSEEKKLIKRQQNETDMILKTLLP